MTWIIEDWMSQRVFPDKSFGSFEEARGFISEHANATTTNEDDYNGVCEDLYAVEVVDPPLDEKLHPLDLLTIGTAEQARDYAINWQTWFSQSDHYMSEHAEWSSAFERLAERFPEVADEFRENAII